MIDGFPRNEENLGNWVKMMGEQVETPFIINLECSEKVMT